jgi:tRNA pseudouridine65 synthase
MVLDICYQDDYLVAINKPHGLLVHRSRIAEEKSQFALQLLRDQLGQRVYPTHRIDRKTGGLLLFALDKELEIKMQKQFQAQEVYKSYWCILRGYVDPIGHIDYALTKENGTVQEAITDYRTISQVELAVPFGKFETSRYSFVEAIPKTGRMHQLRKHFAHIFHPIIGDTKHGCNKQNKLFKEKWQMDTMLLHARSLGFIHPVTGKTVHLVAEPQEPFQEVLNWMGFQITQQASV